HRRDALGHMGGVMADVDAGAQLFEPFGVGAGLGVRALHLIADLQHDLGDAAHADAADADEVDRPEGERNGAKTTGHLRPIAQTGCDLPHAFAGTSGFMPPGPQPIRARRRTGPRCRRCTAWAWPGPAGRRPSPTTSSPAAWRRCRRRTACG